MFKEITSDGTPFVIAEVGQNHQGELDLAREYIRILAFEGADAIAFSRLSLHRSLGCCCLARAP